MIKKIVKNIIKRLPIRNIILFESVPDLSDNTMPVFEEFVRRGYNKKYKFVWMCKNPPRKDYPKIDNVKYVWTEKNRLQVLYYNYFSKAVICCNYFLGCGRKGQTVFYLMHGSPIKDTSSYYILPDYVDYMITEGIGINELSAKQMKCDRRKTVPLGYPRNDVLTHPTVDLHKHFGVYKKYIIWYPTVKQFKQGFHASEIKPVSFFDKEDNVERLNSVAKEKHVLIILKPHFAQLTENVKKRNLSNIVFIDDEYYKKNNITPYDFIGSCDALLTDYSSVFYDYLNCDKPIGFTWDDIEEFKKKPGLVDNYEWLTSCGEKLYQIDDLLKFVSDIANGVDNLKNERKTIRDYVTYSDGQSTKRVADFITEKGNLY